MAKARRSKKLMREVAASLGAPAALGAVLRELLARLPSLGASPGEVVKLVRGARLGRGARVLDLGCGRGEVAVRLAKSMGWRVVAVDGHGPFVDAAKAAARRAGVSKLCRFEVADVRAFERGRVNRRFDVALMLNLYPCGRACGVLRRWVRPGGVYVVDDAFRGARAGAGLGLVPTRLECRRAIREWGDTIEAELVATPSRVRAANKRTVGLLAASCAAMARENPKLRAPLTNYLRSVRRSGRLLGGLIRPCMWLVRRAR